MTQTKLGTGPHASHSHNLSINSVSSIAEPTTPPTGPTASKLWESNKLNGNLALPTFNLDSHALPEHRSHARQFLMDSVSFDKEAKGSAITNQTTKIDKEYLALINKVPLSQLTSDIFRLAKDQHGCRFLQKRIDENIVLNAQVRLSNFTIIFEQVHPMFYELIIDPFGNYLIQKLIDYCDEDNLNLILETLQYNLFLISINQHGTRALQKVIDRMSNSYQLLLLVKGLKPYIIELIKDLNGNHVIQKILNKYSPENCQFIYDSIIADLLVVATHKHGCCVLQKCLNHVNATQLTAFSNEILNYETFTRLVNDQFGNYVLQYLVSIDSMDVNYRLYNNFVTFGVDDLCNLKFSSNVIEKLMKSCYNNEHKLIEFSNLKFTMIALILKCDISKLINDPYGNYVIQTLIDVLINNNVSYYVELPSNERILLPSLQKLLLDTVPNGVDTFQVQIIKIWFQNCKIVSSFGKRIQLKINIILNGVTRVPHRKPLHNHLGNYPLVNMGSNQSMNANGEFVKNDSAMPIMNRFQTRSMSLDNSYSSSNRFFKGQLRTLNSQPNVYGHQQQNHYDGYALNRNMMNVHNDKAAPRTAYDSHKGMDYLSEASLANLHITQPAPFESTVPYARVDQTMTNFTSNEFMSGARQQPRDTAARMRVNNFGSYPDRHFGGNGHLSSYPMGYHPQNVHRMAQFSGRQGNLNEPSALDLQGNLGFFQR